MWTLCDTQYQHCTTHSIETMDQARFDKLRMELRRGVLVLAVLGCLHEPQYGYSLRKHLQQFGIDIDEGTLYPLIRRLEDQGLLDSEWRSDGGRDKRYYRLSKDGGAMLRALREDWQSTSQSLNLLLEQCP